MALLAIAISGIAVPTALLFILVSPGDPDAGGAAEGGEGEAHPANAMAINVPIPANFNLWCVSFTIISKIKFQSY
jgi:hypothetical protein